MGSVVYVGPDRLASFVLGRSIFPDLISSAETRAEESGFLFHGRELWDGKLDETGRPICNGLIRDVVNWMRSRPIAGFDSPDGESPHPFEIFEAVLETLSPPDGDPLVLGPPRRVFIDDSRDIPTMRTPWEPEPVPVNLVAAGMRRILELTYLLVWTWYEQLQVARIKRTEVTKRLFILVDEPETHLHPRWQRAILPALVQVAKKLDADIEVQLFLTTHSPLVLASGETLVDAERDRLFHFDARDGAVVVDQLDWVKQGDAVGWLTSEVFGFTRGGSREGELAIR
ncbi:MAG: ATP-binding protein, partial [Salinibacterium sp.]|nr:ATP-binding protein [Salinibacterium sp.]